MKKLWAIIIVFHVHANTDVGLIINNFLQQYKRAVTILELGKDMKYIPLLANGKHKRVCVMYAAPESNARNILDIANAIKSPNIVALTPQKLGIQELTTLGRCEHFDVSIIDEDTFTGTSLKEALPALLWLGDYLFCIVHKESIEAVYDAAAERKIPVTVIDVDDNKKICICSSLKKGLDIARWNMYRMQPTDYTRYAVCSDFNSKTLRKGCTHSPWTAGINMITFISCNGIFPIDEDIIRMIDSLKDADHNDLVMGNMIIQGKRIAIIDFEDARRNMRKGKCIRVAREFFKSKIRFRKDPEYCLKDYKDTMNSHAFGSLFKH